METELDKTSYNQIFSRNFTLSRFGLKQLNINMHSQKSPTTIVSRKNVFFLCNFKQILLQNYEFSSTVQMPKMQDYSKINYASNWLTLYGHIKTAKQRPIIQQYGDWYTGRWSVSCYIWYSKEEPRPAAAPPSPLLALPNVTAHPSTASVPTSYYSTWQYNCDIMVYMEYNCLCTHNILVRHWNHPLPQQWSLITFNSGQKHVPAAAATTLRRQPTTVSNEMLKSTQADNITDEITGASLGS